MLMYCFLNRVCYSKKLASGISRDEEAKRTRTLSELALYLVVQVFWRHSMNSFRSLGTDKLVPIQLTES